MLGLINLAVELFPALRNAISGNNEARIAEQVGALIKKNFNTDDPTAVQKAIAADPKTADALRIRLAEIALEAQKADLTALQAQREIEFKETAARLESEDKARVVALEQFKATIERDQKERSSILEQIKSDSADTQMAREVNAKILAAATPYSWINPALSLVIVGGFILFCLFIYFSTSKIPDTNKEIFLIALGALAAAFSTVIGFHFGSSSGSKQKDVLKQTETMIEAQKPAGAAVATEAAKAAVGAAVVAEQAAQVVQAQAEIVRQGVGMSSAGAGGTGIQTPLPGTGGTIETSVDRPVPPAGASVFAEEMPNLLRVHRHMPDAVSWNLTARGISVDGAPEARSPGTMLTVPKIWDEFGRECADAARRFGVPVELIVATIATESRGNPNARRVEPDGRESIGLMQTLVETARGELGPSLQPNDLLQPAVSIRAGTSYIARQRGTTRFDPPLVAASYNAGSLRRADFSSNRWRLVCTPRETGAHVDRFIQWFGDAMIVAGEDSWGADGTPSFAAVLLSRDPDDVKSPGFPRRPRFDALTSLKGKQDLFGKFEFRHTPVSGNPERIEILGTWEKENIVSVTLAGIRLPGKNKDLVIPFHRLGEKQLRGLWEDWRNAGLIDRIQTFDGAYNPRFQRGSTSALSNHAFGSAFDINAATNPLGAVPAQIGETGCVRELVALANKWGFFWGGHFRSRLDGMHFEIARIIP